MEINWYIELDLEFDPPVHDEELIEKRIQEKHKEWSTKARTAMNPTQFQNLLKEEDNIRKDMIGESQIRLKMAKEACHSVYAPIDQTIDMVVSSKGSITSLEIDNIVTSKKFKKELVEKRINSKNLKIQHVEKKDNSHLYQKYYVNKPEKFDVFKVDLPELKNFNVDNYYDFLFLHGEKPNFNTLSFSMINAQVEKLKKETYNIPNPITAAGLKVCNRIISDLLCDDDLKKYNVYLDYKKRVDLLNDVKETAKICGELDETQISNFLDKLNMLLKNKELSQDFLEIFCIKENINYNSSVAKKILINTKVCRCGTTNDVSDGRKNCRSCGMDLEISCPSCKSVQDCNVKVCKCGFEFDNLDKALELCEQASFLLAKLDFVSASECLVRAKSLWQTCPRIAVENKKIQELQSKIGVQVSKLEDAIKRKKYFEANNLYQNIKNQYQGFTDIQKETVIKNALERTKVIVDQANNTKDHKQKIDLCKDAISICADYPGITDLLPAPEITTGFKVVANPKQNSNLVTWDSHNDTNIIYILVRSSSVFVQNISDGEVVFEGSATSFNDNTIKAGVTYYYNVFAQNMGVTSKGASGEFKEIVNYFDLKAVNVKVGDSFVNLSWEDVPQNATVEIYEIKNNTQIYLVSSNAGLYVVNNLTNDLVYNFLIKLSYLVNGQKFETIGVNISCTPTCPPCAIDSLFINAIDDTKFDATWYKNDDDQQVEVVLYCSKSKPTFKCDQVTTVSKIEESMSRLPNLPLSKNGSDCLTDGQVGVSFENNTNDLMFVSAVAIKSDCAVFGNICRANVLDDVKFEKAEIANGKINILVKQPQNATGFVVLYRFDKFPLGIEDNDAIKQYTPIKTFLLNGVLLVPNPQEKKYYFSLFSEFRDGRDIDYSSGANYLFDNSSKIEIDCEMKIKKSLLGKKTIHLKFSSKINNFVLPDIDIMTKTGQKPIYKDSSVHFYSISSQSVSGSVEIKIPVEKSLSPNTWIMPFFKDESIASSNKLIIDSKSDFKIS